MNTEFHPRIMAFHTDSTAPNSTSSTPQAQTPVAQSRRESLDGGAARNASVVEQQEKTHKSLNQSIKKMWKEVKQHAAEHHRSVNNAYEATHGAGMRMGSVSVPASRTGSVSAPVKETWGLASNGRMGRGWMG